MTETPTTDLPARIRTDQKRLLDHIAFVMSVPVSAVVRWAIDDARASLLARASLEESMLPEETRRAA
jgi:hypothetical protein